MHACGETAKAFSQRFGCNNQLLGEGCEGSTRLSMLGPLKKISPVIMFLIVVAMIVSNLVLASSMTFEHKATLFALSLAIVIVAVAYEAYRIGKEEELEREALRRKLFGKPRNSKKES